MIKSYAGKKIDEIKKINYTIVKESKPVIKESNDKILFCDFLSKIIKFFK